MKVTCVLLLCLCVAEAAPTAVDPLVEQLSHLLMTGAPREHDWIYGCSDVPSCAGGCKETLAFYTPGPDEVRKPCPELAVAFASDQPFEAREKKVLDWVRAQFQQAILGAPSPALEAAQRDVLDCANGRLFSGRPAPSACARFEARTVAKTLSELPPNVPDLLYLKACGELAGCAAECRARIEAVFSSSVKASGCPAFAPGPGESDEAFRARVAISGRRRFAEWVARQGTSLSSPEAWLLACHAGRLKLSVMPADCPADLYKPPAPAPMRMKFRGPN